MRDRDWREIGKEMDRDSGSYKAHLNGLQRIRIPKLLPIIRMELVACLLYGWTSVDLPGSIST